MESVREPYYFGHPATRTRSQSTTEIVSGSHYFKIHGYSSKKGMGVGKHIASDIFAVGGHQFSIYFYPDGKRVEDIGYVSIFLLLVNGPTVPPRVRAHYKVLLLDHEVDPRKQVQEDFFPPIPPCGVRMGSKWGAYQAFTKVLLESPNYLKDDTLIISCKVGVVVSRQSQELCSIPVFQLDLGKHFGALLLDSIEGDPTFGNNTFDVTFEVDEEVFHAHKLVLAARSPVFKSQFYGQMCSDSSGNIHVKDMVAPVFRAMLHFIYTDVLPDTFGIEASGSCSGSPSARMAEHLFVAADRYGLTSLRLMCESTLSEDLTPETVAATLILADQHQSSQLKAHCLNYTAANLAAVMRSDCFEDLKNSCPFLELQLLRTLAGLELPISQK